ncbi:MAG: 3-isopropylmalate dehydratase [Thermodesulfobacteriota bacterium]|nr:3-isopropylmalate dehydratase [Thermodesulfobacteriota bacterium]
MDQIIQGIVWKCGDGLDAYKIIGKNRWTLDQLDPKELGKWAFEGAEPSIKDIPWGFKNKGYEVVIAGKDFGGGGKSIEHPIVAMKGAGIKVTVAESFARYNFRNSINLGLPAIKCPGVTRIFKTGDKAQVHLLTGEVKNLRTGDVAYGVPLSDFVFALIESGSLLEYTKKRLKGNVNVR